MGTKTKVNKCSKCNGSGKIKIEPKRKPLEEGIFTQYIDCWYCHGTGYRAVYIKHKPEN